MRTMRRRAASKRSREEVSEQKMELGKVICAIFAVLLSAIVYFLLKPTTYEPIKPLEEKWWGDGVRKEENEEVVPFEVKFRQCKYTDLMGKLRTTRYFESLEKIGWNYGTRPDFMKTVVDFWIYKFSWSNQVSSQGKFSKNLRAKSN